MVMMSVASKPKPIFKPSFSLGYRAYSRRPPQLNCFSSFGSLKVVFIACSKVSGLGVQCRANILSLPPLLDNLHLVFFSSLVHLTAKELVCGGRERMEAVLLAIGF